MKTMCQEFHSGKAVGAKALESTTVWIVTLSSKEGRWDLHPYICLT